MSGTSSIEWTDATWNPLTGCRYASEGCLNCYAARESAGRLSTQPAYVGLTVKGASPARFNGQVRLLPDRLDQPLRWRKPRRIFVNSMSDLFYTDVDYGFIVEVFATMALASHHQFQLLTKRPKRMASIVGDTAGLRTFEGAVRDAAYARMSPGEGRALFDDGWSWPLPNVWLGTSIESNKWAFRADHLRHVPAAVRWISAEPLLTDLEHLDLDGIDWLVAGGESGPGARPMHPGWARDLRDRAVTWRIPFLFKQWGEWVPANGTEMGTPRLVEDPAGRHQPAPMFRVGKKTAGRLLDGRTWDEYPHVEAAA